MSKKSTIFRIFAGALLVCFIMSSLTGCIDSEAKKVSEQISQIGTVSLTSGDAIESTEKAYSSLSEKSRANVENYEVLVEARKTYDRICEVYELIESIGEVTKDSEEAIIKAEQAYEELSMEEKACIINYATLTAARTAFDDIPTIIELNKENISQYFEIDCELSTSHSTSYGVTKHYKTDARISSSAKLIKSVETIDSVTIKINVTYSLDKLSYGKSNHTVTLTVQPSASNGIGSDSYDTKQELVEMIGGPSLGYPKYELISWEISEVSGSITVK